jgi:hypothetical protein
LTKTDRCTRCVLPSTTPNITFNDEGICNYCLTYQKFIHKGEEELLKILDSHRSNRKYDCLVTISGGRDSAYVLLKLVKDYRMKVLAVNYENPFTHPQAKENIKNMIRILNVDIVQFRHKNQIHERTLRDNLKVWLRKPSPAAVPMICIGCRLMWREIIRIARKHDIHCLVSGSNPLENASFKKVLLHIPEDAPSKFYSPQNLPGIVLEAFKNISYLKPRYLSTTLKSFLFTNPSAIGSVLLGHGMDKIDLFHFIKWDEKEIISRIKSELDWDYPAEAPSTWRFDCKIEHLKDYMYLKTLGMTEKDDFYSKMIREGLITREAALARLEKENVLPPDIIEQVLGKGEILEEGE